MGMLLYMTELEMAQKVNKGVAEKVAPSSTKVEIKPEQTELEFTAEEIKKMTGPKLRKLAKKNGVDSPEEYTVAELKAILCEKYS